MNLKIFAALLFTAGFLLAAPKDYVCSKSQLETISKGKGELAFSGRSIIMVDTIEFEKWRFTDHMNPTDVVQTLEKKYNNWPKIKYDFLYEDRLRVFSQPNANDFVFLLAEKTDWSASVMETSSVLGNHYKYKAMKIVTKKSAKKYPKGTGYIIQNVDLKQDRQVYIKYEIDHEEYYSCSGKKLGENWPDIKFSDGIYKGSVLNEKSLWYKEARFLQKIKSGESYPSRVY